MDFQSDANAEIATMSLITHVRLGYFPDSPSLLQSAYDRAILAPDDYFGELAHLFDISQPTQQEPIAKTLSNSRNLYAGEIIASSVIDHMDSTRKFSPATTESIRSTLQQTEPVFSSGLAELGGMEVLKYQVWVRATARMEILNSGDSLESAIVRKLSQPGTDQRKILAYLSSSEAMPLIAKAKDNQDIANLIESAGSFAAQFPNAPVLQELAQRIGKRTEPVKVQTD